MLSGEIAVKNTHYYIFVNHYNRCCPLKKATKLKQSKDKMWFTDGWKKEQTLHQLCERSNPIK